MSMLTKDVHLTVEEYLEGEKYAETRHEYERGRVVAMVGASRTHNRIAVNLTTALDVHLRGGLCQVFMADMKVRVDECFYYPDVVVGCDPEDRHEYFLLRPRLIVEVLSETTEQRDRMDKRLAYQALASLEEYVLVAQDRRQVEIYRRTGSDSWNLDSYGESEDVWLKSAELKIPMSEISQGI